MKKAELNYQEVRFLAWQHLKREKMENPASLEEETCLNTLVSSYCLSSGNMCKTTENDVVLNVRGIQYEFKYYNSLHCIQNAGNRRTF